MENVENRMKIIENSLLEVQNNIDLQLGNIYTELKANPKKAAKKASKIALDSFEGISKMFPTETVRMKAWWRIMKVKLIKWGIPSALIFAGYLLRMLLV